MKTSIALPVPLSALCWTILFFLLSSSWVTASPVRFVVTGDSWGSDNGVNTAVLGEIARATVAEGVAFTLIIGDLTNGYAGDRAGFESKLTTWRDAMQPVYDAGIGVYPCRGNHDAAGINPGVDPSGTLAKAAWDNVFSGPYALPGNGPVGEENITYSFSYQNVLVVCLDQYGKHPHRVNQAWLEEQLAANPLPQVFVFGHEPAFKILHEDCLDDYPDDRNTFWGSIASGCGRTYFCGHDHFYDHARIDNGDGNSDNDLHQFDIATSGSSLYHWDGSYDGNNTPWVPRTIHHEEDVYGYLLVEVDGLEVTITWKKRTAPGVFEAGGDVLSYTSACGSGTSACLVKRLYGDNGRTTRILRRYRDTVLSKSPAGRQVMKLYYLWSPAITKAVEVDDEFKETVTGMIDDLVPLIE